MHTDRPCTWIALGAILLSASIGLRAQGPATEPSILRESVDAAAAIPVPSATVWQQRRIHAGIVYFLDNTTIRLRRYELASASWLADIPLAAASHAFDVDASGIYVKSGSAVRRYSLAGQDLGDLPTASGAWQFLELVGNYVVLGGNSSVRTYDKQTGAPVASLNTGYQMSGYDSSKSEGRIFGLNLAVYPSDIVRLQVNPASGALESIIDSPYHGAFPTGTRVHAREGGGWVFDSSGTVYSSPGLLHLGNLGGSIQGAAFLQDKFIVMRGADLVVFSNDLRETGRMQPPTGLVDIMGIGNTLYAITGTIGDLHIASIDPATAGPVTAPPAREWWQATPKATFVLGDGTKAVLVSASEHAAYPFDPQAWSFGPAVPMLPGFSQATYSATTGIVYGAYPGGAIYAYPLATPGSVGWLAATAYTAQGLAAAGEYIMAADASGAWASHYMFSPTGSRLSWVEWNYLSRQYEWDPASRKMYFLRDDTSPNDLMWERIAADGTIVEDGESPYHGGLSFDVPIRISPYGTGIALGSGLVMDPVNLSVVHDLAGQMAEYAWINGDLYAITRGESRLNRYSSGYDVVSSGRVRGEPRRLLPAGSTFLYVADIGPSTIVGRLDPLFAKADLAVDPVAPGALFAAGSTITLRVNVGNNGVVPAFGARVVADLSILDQPTWRCIAGVHVSACTGSITAGSIDHVLDIEDGGQATFEISGRIPAGAQDFVVLTAGVSPASAGSDPELRNNTQVIRLAIDALFADGFD